MSNSSTCYPKSKVISTFVVLVGANILIWTWAWIAFADRPTLLGTALLAYIFGLRHAFDPDHIAAIDNVVRKLIHRFCRDFGNSTYDPAERPERNQLGANSSIGTFPARHWRK